MQKCSVATGGFEAGDKNADELIDFMAKRITQSGGAQVRVSQVTEPEGRFIGFLKAIAQLGNKLRLGAATTRFAIIGSDGRPGATS